MNNPSEQPGTQPEIEPQVPRPAQPQPVEPQRKSFTQPTFGRGLTTVRALFTMALSLFFTCTMLMAQSDSTRMTTRTNTRTQPGTTGTNRGWTMFDAQNTRTYDLQNDQLQRLQDVDTKYQGQYKALGTQPWTNAGYGTLNDQRNADVRSILTPAQYDSWIKANAGTTMPSGRSTTTPGTNTNDGTDKDHMQNNTGSPSKAPVRP